MSSVILFLLLTGGYQEHLQEPDAWFLHNGLLVAGDRTQSPYDSEGYPCYTKEYYAEMQKDLQAAEDCADGVPSQERWHPFHPYNQYTLHRGQLTQDEKVKAPSDSEFEGGMCRSPENDDGWYRWLKQNEDWYKSRFVQYWA